MNVHAGVEIREALRFRFAVIAKLRMIEALAHVLGERNRPRGANALGEQLSERRRERQARASLLFGRLHASFRCGLQVNISIT